MSPQSLSGGTQGTADVSQLNARRLNELINRSKVSTPNPNLNFFCNFPIKNKRTVYDPKISRRRNSLTDVNRYTLNTTSPASIAGWN